MGFYVLIFRFSTKLCLKRQTFGYAKKLQLSIFFYCLKVIQN